MKVIWIMSRPLLGTLGTPKQNHTGSWVDAAFERLKDNKNIEIHAVYITKGCKEQIEKIDRHFTYKLPKAKYCNVKDLKPWIELEKNINPDIMMIWGSEQGIALAPITALKNIPKLLYIQGLLNNIVVNFNGGLTCYEIIKSFCFFDLFKLKWIPILRSRYKRRARTELEVLNKVDAVILENDWCAGQIRILAPHSKIYRSLLPIKKEFFSYDWDINLIERHTIFTNSGGLPLKGHHTLFKALRFVVRKYPDTKLLIPGPPIDCSTFKKKLRTTGYHRYLQHLLKKYGIQNNVKYLGILPAFDDVANHCKKCNVFVVPSYAENHSSSLIEAMLVGAPCISTYVGGVQNMAQNGENVLIYNPTDAVALANNIIQIFEKDDLAIKLSKNAKLIRSKRNVDVGNELYTIYKDLLCN